VIRIISAHYLDQKRGANCVFPPLAGASFSGAKFQQGSISN